MSRIKFIMLALVAMLFVGVFASASASAAHRFVDCLKAKEAGKGQWNNNKCTELGGSKEWETKEVASGEKVSGTSGVSLLTSKIKKAEVIITCTKDIFTGTLEAAGASKGEVVFEGCSVGNKTETFKACEVPNIKFKFTDLLVLEEPKAGELEIADEFKPAVAGEPFVIIKINNFPEKTCTVKGEYKVAGTQICLLPEGTAFKVLHEIGCKTIGSHLTFEGEEATFESTESLQLASGDAWAVE
jgi:hypothetical protein